jgi:hypothetical protein
MATNWISKTILQFQVWSFTILLLMVNALANSIVINNSNKETFSILLKETYGMDFLTLLIVIPLLYALFWFLGIWILTKNTASKFYEKLIRHPIISIILLISFLVDLPFRIPRLSEIVYISKSVHIFESIISYGFIIFLWWLLFCYLSNLLIKSQILWKWYKRLIDKIFIFAPGFYKVVLGIISVLFIFKITIYVLYNVFNYSGHDIEKLLN